MKDAALSPDDHIVRYVGGSLIRDDGSVLGEAFRLRPNRPEESGLSVNWLEIFGLDRQNQLAEVRRLFRMQRGTTGRFAEMNVGRVLDSLAEELESAGAIHKPLPKEGIHEPDPSHAEIVGVPRPDTLRATLIGDLIAECVTELHPAFTPEGD